MFYLTTHSTHFIYSYIVSDIWLRTILIVREETRCRHMGYSFRLAARVILYAPSHRQDSTYHALCYTSRGALAGTGNPFSKVMNHGQTCLAHSICSRKTISATRETCPAPVVPVSIQTNKLRTKENENWQSKRRLKREKEQMVEKKQSLAKEDEDLMKKEEQVIASVRDADELLNDYKHYTV